MTRSYLKETNLWVHNWSQASKHRSYDIDKYMQRLLKYYPKNLQVLKQITQSSSQNLLAIPQEKELKIIQRRVLKRYKKDFFKNLSLDISSDHLDLTKVTGNLRSLKLYQKVTSVRLPLALRRKIIIYNKRLKYLDLLQFDDLSVFVFKSMKHIKNLAGIAFQKVPKLSKAEWKNILLNSNRNLQCITILRDSYYRSAKPEDNIQNLLEIGLELSSLRIIHIDGRLSEYCDITTIPFDKFLQRHLRYNIRVSHTKENINFSQNNLDALNQLDFLGINLQRQWSVESGLWNNFPDEHLKLQEYSKTLLFIHFPYVKTLQADFSHIFFTCRNVSTLDLSLSEENPSILNFSGLSNLTQLKHIFLTLHSFQHSYKNLFTNLVLSIQKTQSLKTLALTFNKTGVSNEDDCLVSVFKACKDTLIKILLDFSKSTGDAMTIDRLYQEISQLTCLKSFKLIISQPESEASCHDQSLNLLLQNSNLLEEFFFISSDLPNSDISLNFRGSKHLKKVQLIQERIKLDSRNLENISQLARVTSIKIGKIDLSSEKIELKDLCKIFMKFVMLQAIEIVFINNDQNQEFDVVQANFEALMNEHPNLKLIILYDQDIVEITVLKRGYCWADVDKYLEYSRTKSVVQCSPFSFY